MKLCIDHADVDRIRCVYDRFPVDGVSTNPSILAACGRPPFEVLREIRSIIGEQGELFVQVVSADASGMVAEARRIVSELGEGTLAKVPSTPEGFKAMRALKAEGIRFIGTAVYTVMQGVIAAKCGAEYVAPYVNRIDNMGFDGVNVALQIHEAIAACGFESGLLAASFKNSQQVIELARRGVKGVTVVPDLIEGMVSSPSIDAAVDAFTADFERLVGPGATMTSC